jgi:TRAP-type C4-dicarboxylate transport system permease small subunit
MSQTGEAEGGAAGFGARGMAAYHAVLAGLAVLLLGLIVAIMGAQVFARYMLNASMIWAEETCRYLLVWLSFLFAGLAYSRGELASVAVLTDKLGARAALWLGLATRALIVVFLVGLAWWGWRFAAFNASLTIPSLGFIATDLFGADRPFELSMAFVHAAVPVGSLMLAGHVLVSMAMDLRRLRSRGRPR